MGKAAYDRGSAAITCSIYGHDLSVPAPVVPRPDDWGSKAHTRALNRARGLVRYFKKRGSRYTSQEIARMVRDEQKCGQTCAINAALEADAEYWGDRFDDPIVPE